MASKTLKKGDFLVKKAVFWPLFLPKSGPKRAKNGTSVLLVGQ